MHGADLDFCCKTLSVHWMLNSGFNILLISNSFLRKCISYHWMLWIKPSFPINVYTMCFIIARKKLAAAKIVGNGIWYTMQSHYIDQEVPCPQIMTPFII